MGNDRDDQDGLAELFDKVALSEPVERQPAPILKGQTNIRLQTTD